MRRAAGFTLIELVLALAIAALLTAAVAQALGNGARAFRHQRAAAGLLEEMRHTGTRLIRELRAAGSRDLVVTDRRRLVFRRPDRTGHPLQVTLDGRRPPRLTIGYEQVPGHWTLSNHVRDIRFAYLDARGRPLPAGNTRPAYIRVQLSYQDDQGHRRRQRLLIALRNP